MTTPSTKKVATHKALEETASQVNTDIIKMLQDALKPKVATVEAAPVVNGAVAVTATAEEVPATPLHKIKKEAKPAAQSTAPAGLVDVECFGGELLLHHVTLAHALGRCEALREQVVMSHDIYGAVSLKMIEHNNQFVIGLIDNNKATYCECETFNSRKSADAVWTEWLAATQL